MLSLRANALFWSHILPGVSRSPRTRRRQGARSTWPGMRPFLAIPFTPCSGPVRNRRSRGPRELICFELLLFSTAAPALSFAGELLESSTLRAPWRGSGGFTNIHNISLRFFVNVWLVAVAVHMVPTLCSYRHDAAHNPRRLSSTMRYAIRGDCCLGAVH